MAQTVHGPALESTLGVNIDRDEFEEHEFAAFSEKLRDNLNALRRLLERPGFGAGRPSLGAELEMSLVDGACRPLLINQRVIRDTRDPRFTLELNRFNLECNTRPVELSEGAFAGLEQEFTHCLARVRSIAATHGARVALIGILPTLTSRDLEPSAMTDLARYRALSNGIRRLRQKPFHVRIDGEDPLDIECDDVTYEGANTSFQVHLRCDPSEFAARYNAAQLATAPALAVAGNSPSFLGHQLWEETRIALFKKAVDDRQYSRGPDRRVPRVCFGLGWLERDALELFSETVELHEPLLPVLSGEDPMRVVEDGGVPELSELRLHNGTVWRWNRAVYDPADGGHLRVEMRALPSGPTVRDMLANAAFLVGLILDLSSSTELRGMLTFEAAHGSFYRAAKQGLHAELLWPNGDRLTPVSARDLVLELVPRARRGLRAAGLDQPESDRLLDIIAERAEKGQTGAVWQRQRLATLERSLDRPHALERMFSEYLDRSESNAPVHTWPLA